MHASQYFKITRESDDDWFDPILNADTKLFVDPFLIFKEKTGAWTDAHDIIIKHFDQAFMLIAEGNLNRQSLAYRKALGLLVFHEPKELCLGYTGSGTAGAGSGRGFAQKIGIAIENAINRGVMHLRHFEELGIFELGIGADRISDIACTILKRRLIEYTQDIAKRHGIPLDEHRIFASGFDQRRLRWITETVKLPTNPTNADPLLLVPGRFLRKLPVLNSDDWWEDWENERLRTDLNYEVMRNVNKSKIVATAKAYPEAVQEWIEQKEQKPAEPYDFDADPEGVSKWVSSTEEFANQHPIHFQEISSEEQFLDVIRKIIEQFKLFVEEKGGWSLLWDSQSDKEKPEDAVQLLFRGIGEHYCRANNISMDREVNFGRGPVDFKFSSGYKSRAHLEVKKLHSGRFWNGLEEQLPSYMNSDEVSVGWFLAIRYREGEKWDKRQRELSRRVAAVRKQKGLAVNFDVVDACRPVSASNL